MWMRWRRLDQAMGLMPNGRHNLLHAFSAMASAPDLIRNAFCVGVLKKPAKSSFVFEVLIRSNSFDHSAAVISPLLACTSCAFAVLVFVRHLYHALFASDCDIDGEYASKAAILIITQRLFIWIKNISIRFHPIAFAVRNTFKAQENCMNILTPLRTDATSL